jgi:DNA-binding CsgD family transcriptional regulator
MLSCSVIPKSGNLRVYFKDSPDSNKYSFDSEKWKNRQDERLTEQEILILWLSKQKICNKQIADQLYISYDRLRHIKTQLFKKLKVKTMGHAIIYATNHLMLFVPNAKVFNVNICEKQYNKLTSDRLSRIQIRLDNNQSINSIAKDEDVSEGAIRKAIKNGKLIKNWK